MMIRWTALVDINRVDKIRETPVGMNGAASGNSRHMLRALLPPGGPDRGQC